MSGMSRHFRMSRLADRVARALEPDELLERRHAVNSAVSRSGQVVASAIPANTLHLSDAIHDPTGASTSSTSVWATAASTSITLTSGQWKFRASCYGRIVNSSASNVDAQLLINGEMVAEDTKAAPSAGAAPMNLTGTVILLEGGAVTVEAQVKSDSAGTSQYTGLVLEWFADRQ